MNEGEANMLHIWGRANSINVRKVVWAAQETGEPFKRTDAGGKFGGITTPEYVRMNPNALIPVLQHGDVTLWESNVIVRYLAARFPQAGLLPSDLAQRFEAEQWMDWQQTTLNPAGRDGFMQLIRTPVEKRQSELLQRSINATEPLMALLDRRLAQQPFIVGSQFTVADIPLACEVHRWFGLPRSRPVWPHLERWLDTVRSRPAAQGVLDQILT